MRSDLDVPLKKGLNDKEYLCILKNSIRILKNIRSDLIFFQAGVDVLSHDTLGYLEISREGVKKRNEIVLEFAKEKKAPLVVFMGGGYAKPIKHSVDSFTDLFLQCSGYANLFN